MPVFSLAWLYWFKRSVKGSLGVCAALSPYLTARWDIGQRDHLVSSLVLIYLPLLIRASAGLVAPSGISQVLPAFCTSGIRPSAQRTPTRRDERFHSLPISVVVRYFIIVHLGIMLTILYSLSGTISISFWEDGFWAAQEFTQVQLAKSYLSSFCVIKNPPSSCYKFPNSQIITASKNELVCTSSLI